jgi:LuxR family maltose regulon positive regulatory protein
MALLETKLFLPRARDDLIARPRLDELMRSRGRVTLVSAPAGFGKTTVISAWLSQERGRVAWVSLDAADRESESFWSYVLTALERAAPGTGAAGLALLAGGQPVEGVLAAVLNEVSVLDDEVVLVLDDYHVAESREVQRGVSFLVDRLPPQLRLVISTRADPGLPLARLRARGELIEVRAGDLRFTDGETTAFLAEATGLDLAESEVAALGQRTEGWIASLQLAAISLRGRSDPSAFIAGFAGNDRYVMDYLVEEVLAEEPPAVRDFLLDTAVLDRLSVPLCQAVTGQADDGTLAALERRNLFVVPLDDHRTWYRYHHLFADVLRAHLVQERPDAVAGLHRRASDWYAEAGSPEDAVRHALAAGDTGRAAELIELAIPALRRERRESVLRRWAGELPADLLLDRPVLAIGLVGGLMASNDFASVPDRLDAIERTLARPDSELVVADREELARLPAALETYRAGLALIGGNPAGTIELARRAAEVAPEDDDLTRSAAAALAGLASWGLGDVPAAHAAYQESARGLTRAGHIADVLGCSLTLADLELALGRLDEAEGTLEHALALAEEHRGADVMRGTADMLVALSRVAWHRNDLAHAADLVSRAETLGESAGLPQHPYRWRVALARLRAAARDFPTALELLDDAQRVYVGDFSPQVHPIHATQARLLIASGDVAGANAWADRHDLDPDDELSYLREYEHLTLARLLLARRSPAALTLLARLGAAAVSGDRLGTVVETEALRAAALDPAGDAEAADAALQRALEIGEPEGWVRVFVDAGPGLLGPLRRVAGRRRESAYVRTLLAACTSPGPSDETPAPSPVGSSALVDPLSDRELDVLRLLASELDGPGIARELVVSLNTVRTHTKHIYTKLDVNNRRQAISRAHQLGLLSRRG